MMCLCAPGEVVLLRAPQWVCSSPSDSSYNGFDVNMTARTRCIPYNVPVADDVGAFTQPGIELEALEKAYADCTAKGLTVRAVVRYTCTPLTPAAGQPPQPARPGVQQGRACRLCAVLRKVRPAPRVGRDLRAQRVRQPQWVLGWESLMAEIPNAPGFHSVASVDFEKELGTFDKSRVHIVYSFSKESVRSVFPTHSSFGINGFRVACLISQHNAFLLRTMLHYAFLMKGGLGCSTYTSFLPRRRAHFVHAERQGELQAVHEAEPRFTQQELGVRQRVVRAAGVQADPG